VGSDPCLAKCGGKRSVVGADDHFQRAHRPFPASHSSHRHHVQPAEEPAPGGEAFHPMPDQCCSVRHHDSFVCRVQRADGKHGKFGALSSSGPDLDRAPLCKFLCLFCDQQAAT